MRKVAITMIFAVALLGLWGIVAHVQDAQAGAAAQAAPPVLNAPTDKAAYWANGDIQGIWKDLEAKQVINKRVMEGGAYSINVRIVKEGDAPLVHAKSVDTWVVQAGTATVVTGGKLNDIKQRPGVDDASGSSISGGTEQALKAGDVIFIPPGVPHGFKDIKGFRAFLIRWDVK